ncbi:hypothetical protein P4S52_17085 [Vibrio sp. SA48]
MNNPFLSLCLVTLLTASGGGDGGDEASNTSKPTSPVLVPPASPIIQDRAGNTPDDTATANIAAETVRFMGELNVPTGFMMAQPHYKRSLTSIKLSGFGDNDSQITPTSVVICVVCLFFRK